ncbi:MAG: hypothetical protein RLY32_2338 [Pseudomonadota bacterium]
MKNIPQHARIVIVGGGIVGCSTAYHLARLGFKDILLLEQGRLTSDSLSAGWGIEHGSCVGLGYVYDEWAGSHHQGTQAEVMLWGEPSPVLLYSL